MTECLDNISQHHDDKTHTGFDSVQFHESTNEMLDKFTELFRKFNSEIYQSYRLLNVSGNGFNMKNFTHPAGDVRDYKENIMGQCVISNVKNVPDQHCYIIDTARWARIKTDCLVNSSAGDFCTHIEWEKDIFIWTNFLFQTYPLTPFLSWS